MEPALPGGLQGTKSAVLQTHWWVTSSPWLEARATEENKREREMRRNVMTGYML
jgi:hypothetical protein